MSEPPIVMMYNFAPFKFEFRADGIIFITDRKYRRKFKMDILNDPQFNLIVTLEEENVKDNDSQ